MSEATQGNASFGLPPTLEDLQAEIAALKAQLAAKNEPVVEPLGDLDSQGFPKVYVKVRVFKGQNATDKSHVDPSIGGYAMRIQRGEDVIIPEVFAQVLDHAVEDITIKSEGGLVTRPSHRFPFTILGPATEEQYLAQRATHKAMTPAPAMPG